MNDQAIEQEIQAKGLTAPRVTLADLEANIADTEVLKHVSRSGQVLRWAILTTRNGFAVVGKPSVAVSAENDNAEIGQNIAIDNAKDELWPLMGYALKQQLHVAETGPWPCKSCRDAFPAGDASEHKPAPAQAK
ncbi:Gp49 family protein [Pseudomonas chlororaphis]|uniref:Gp49 family protein n=1 Tax=Pseudomonas chlororaphis TaxID=587753 RepID=UPI000F556566